jgi:hypothetical protein
LPKLFWMCRPGCLIFPARLTSVTADDLLSA